MSTRTSSYGWRPVRMARFFKIDWDGNVLGAIGNGPGRGEGQFVESNYLAMDSQGNLYTGDTSVGRITKMVAPRNDDWCFMGSRCGRAWYAHDPTQNLPNPRSPVGE